MSKYIELGKAIEAVNGAFKFEVERAENYRDIAVETLKLLPTVEVRHGRWEWVRFNIECSECGCMPEFDSREPLYNYCPNCGAKMEECEVVSETGTPPEWGDRSWAFRGGAKMDEVLSENR